MYFVACAQAESDKVAADGGELSPAQRQLSARARDVQDHSPQVPGQHRMYVFEAPHTPTSHAHSIDCVVEHISSLLHVCTEGSVAAAQV